MRLVLKSLLGLVVLATFATPAAACDLAAGQPVAAEVQSTVNAMIEAHRTSCQPAEAKGLCSIVCTTDARLEAAEPWAFIVSAAAGQAARTRGLAKFSEVRAMDRRLGEARKYFRTDIAQAAAVQQAMAANRLDMRGGLREWMKATETVAIPAN